MTYPDPLRVDTNHELAVVFARLTAKHDASSVVRAIRHWVEASERVEAAGKLNVWLDILREHSVAPDELRSFLWKDKT